MFSEGLTFYCISFGLQLAVASGATVILTSSSDEKLMIGIDLGASYVINYNTTPNWDEEVLRIVSEIFLHETRWRLNPFADEWSRS